MLLLAQNFGAIYQLPFTHSFSNITTTNTDKYPNPKSKIYQRDMDVGIKQN